jgi:hypothetical protein
MHRNNKLLIIFTVIIVALSASITTFTSQERPHQSPLGSGQRKAPQQGQARRKEELDKDFPVANYNEPDPADPVERAERREKNKRYDRANLVSVHPNVKDTEVAVFYEGSNVVPALPTAISEVVVIGEVLNAKAYLSNDKTNVYSELTLRVSEVLKNKSPNPLVTTNLILAQRAGGFVTYPNGHKMLYRVVGHGMPGVGRRYLLFLNTITGSQTYQILTGYELGANGAFPLDYSEQFHAYAGTDEETLSKAVRDAAGHNY